MVEVVWRFALYKLILRTKPIYFNSRTAAYPGSPLKPLSNFSPCLSFLAVWLIYYQGGPKNSTRAEGESGRCRGDQCFLTWSSRCDDLPPHHPCGLVADGSGNEVVQADIHLVDGIVSPFDPCGVYPAPAVNPRSTERLPSASSGGSVAAVASGVLQMALGSDTGALSAYPLRYAVSLASSQHMGGCAEPVWNPLAR